MVSSRQRGLGAVQVVWTLAGLLVAALAGLHIFLAFRDSSTQFATPYQAVLLTNGSVYFGRLQDYGTPHPVLTDVYYVVSQTDVESKQITNSLIRRGQELHAPDRMYLNPSHIIFVESVGTDSKVAQLIAQAPH